MTWDMFTEVGLIGFALGFVVGGTVVSTAVKSILLKKGLITKQHAYIWTHDKTRYP